jgi:hypothetical protein
MEERMLPEQKSLLQELYVIKGSHLKLLMALHICGGSVLKTELNACLVELGGNKLYTLTKPTMDMADLGLITITYAEVSRRKATYTITAQGSELLSRIKN